MTSFRTFSLLYLTSTAIVKIPGCISEGEWIFLLEITMQRQLCDMNFGDFVWTSVSYNRCFNCWRLVKLVGQLAHYTATGHLLLVKCSLGSSNNMADLSGLEFLLSEHFQINTLACSYLLAMAQDILNITFSNNVLLRFAFIWKFVRNVL